MSCIPWHVREVMLEVEEAGRRGDKGAMGEGREGKGKDSHPNVKEGTTLGHTRGNSVGW